MAARLHIILLLLTSASLRADVLDAVPDGHTRSETPQTSSILRDFQDWSGRPERTSAEFRQRQTVHDWLSQADQNLHATQPPQERGPLPDASTSSGLDERSTNSAVVGTEMQPFLLLIPRSGYRGSVSNPVVSVGDPDVIFDLQHPAFRSPLRQVYIDRCSAEFRSHPGGAWGQSSADATMRGYLPAVPGVLDSVCSAIRNLEARGAGLRFQDPALSRIHNQICQPDLAMASQPFQLRIDHLPGKPFRPIVSLQNLLQRLQATSLNLKLLTSAKLHRGRNSGFSAFPGPLTSRWWVLPAGGSCLLLCGLFAMRFRHPVH
jgi:hypothetical protein